MLYICDFFLQFNPDIKEAVEFKKRFIEVISKY